VFRGLFPCNHVKCLKVKYVTRRKVALEGSKGAWVAPNERTVKTASGELRSASCESAKSVSESQGVSFARVTVSCIEKNKVFFLVLLFQSEASKIISIILFIPSLFRLYNYMSKSKAGVFVSQDTRGVYIINLPMLRALIYLVYQLSGAF